MADLSNKQHLMSLEEVQAKADQYLKNRYFDFEKIRFDSHEITAFEGSTMFRLHGGIRAKSRSLIDNMGFFKKPDTYKFLIEIDAVNGKIINYEFK